MFEPGTLIRINFPQPHFTRDIRGLVLYPVIKKFPDGSMLYDQKNLIIIRETEDYKNKILLFLGFTLIKNEIVDLNSYFITDSYCSVLYNSQIFVISRSQYSYLEEVFVS